MSTINMSLITTGRPVLAPAVFRSRQWTTLKFPGKLWRIVNFCHSEVVTWSSDGSTIRIHRSQFQEKFLKNTDIFQTTQFSSFVRQLNLYGFKKVIHPITFSHIRMYGEEEVYVEYNHPMFKRGCPELLQYIQRQSKQSFIGRPNGSTSLLVSKENTTTFRSVLCGNKRKLPEQAQLLDKRNIDGLCPSCATAASMSAGHHLSRPKNRKYNSNKNCKKDVNFSGTLSNQRLPSHETFPNPSLIRAEYNGKADPVVVYQGNPTSGPLVRQIYLADCEKGSVKPLSQIVEGPPVHQGTQTLFLPLSVEEVSYLRGNERNPPVLKYGNTPILETTNLALRHPKRVNELIKGSTTSLNDNYHNKRISKNMFCNYIVAHLTEPPKTVKQTQHPNNNNRGVCIADHNRAIDLFNPKQTTDDFLTQQKPSKLPTDSFGNYDSATIASPTNICLKIPPTEIHDHIVPETVSMVALSRALPNRHAPLSAEAFQDRRMLDRLAISREATGKKGVENPDRLNLGRNIPTDGVYQTLNFETAEVDLVITTPPRKNRLDKLIIGHDPDITKSPNNGDVIINCLSDDDEDTNVDSVDTSVENEDNELTMSDYLFIPVSDSLDSLITVGSNSDHVKTASGELYADSRDNSKQMDARVLQEIFLDVVREC